MLKVVRGKKTSAVRVCLYGPEGVGKTTWGSRWPSPLFVDVERGSGQLDVARVEPASWSELVGVFLELARGAQGFGTVVVDTVDAAERLAADEVCRAEGKRSIEAFGYGRGHVQLGEKFGQLLQAADQLVATGVHVVLLAHAGIRRVSLPDVDESFDRFELRAGKHVAPLVREWCDLLGFANYETRLVEGADGKVRARGGRKRLLHTQRTASYDAKSRYELPAVMDLDTAGLADVLRGSESVPSSKGVELLAKVEAAIAAERTSAGLERIRQKVAVKAADRELTDEQLERVKAAMDERQLAIAAELSKS